MIYVSLPGTPEAYPSKATYNPEISHFVLNGLKSRYKDVTWVKYQQPPPKFDPKDIFVTQIFGSYGALPKDRVILVETANFESNKWVSSGEQSRYTKHGVSKENEIDGVYQVRKFMEGVGSALLMSNDIAMEKYKSDHEDITIFKKDLLSLIGNIDMAPHPLDKQRYLRFFNPDFIPSVPKMLIYHAGPRKNSLQFWRMVDQMGYKDGIDYVSSPYVNKDDHNLLRAINNTYHMYVSCSYSECGPINVPEFMYQGLLILGHEEWWNAYGYNKTLWSYDPSRYQEMQDNVRWLMDPKNLEEIKQMRNDILKIYVDRKDNEWPYFLEKLFKMVDVLL